MPVTIKKEANERRSGAVINSRVRSFAKDPYFVKKTEEAKATIKKVGLPGSKKK